MGALARSTAIVALLVALLVALGQQRGLLEAPQVQAVLRHPAVSRVVEAVTAALARRPAPTDEGACSCGLIGDIPGQEAACNLDGPVIDCCCTYAAVEHVNRDEVKPILDELVKTPFFRYFKVDLYCECPLWPDDGMCSLRDCSVCECEPHEVPEPWRKAETVDSCESAQRESDVDRTLQPSMKARLLSVRDWRGYRNPWMPEGDEGVDYAYINLVRNEERYTGYKGEHANRVWGAIYGQPIFANISDPGVPTEQRVFYRRAWPRRRPPRRLISGMHSSITAHIVGDYLLDEAQGIWGPNLEMFKWRLGNPAVKDRVENLYFAYLFVLRAAMKAGPILEAEAFDTGLPEDDAGTQQLVRRLVGSSMLQQTCPIPFDEGRLWKGEHDKELRAELRRSFQNITRIMDCVGCEKCKMWGKLQLLGIATSLKILFSADDCSGHAGDAGLVLERNEVIALVNLLHRLSLGVEVVRDLSLQLAAREGFGAAEQARKHPAGLGAIQDLFFTDAPVLAPHVQQAGNQSALGGLLASKYAGHPGVIALSGGFPSPQLFPYARFSLHTTDGLAIEVAGPAAAAAQQYNYDLRGQASLLAWAEAHTTALHAPPPGVGHQVMITNGGNHSLELVFSLFLDRGDSFLVEEYSYPVAVESMAVPKGYIPVGVPIDADGIVPAALEQVLADLAARAGQPGGPPFPKLLYTIPHGQNPTGCTMPHERKTAVYAIARRYGLLILEDDPYVYLQFKLAPDGKPVPPEEMPGLRGIAADGSYLSLDVDGRVIRVDTFAKFMAPGELKGEREGTQRPAPGLGDCPPGGGGEAGLRHPAANRGALLLCEYARRAACMLAAARRELGGLAKWAAPTAGMFLWVRLLDVEDAGAVWQELCDAGVVVMPGKPMHWRCEDPTFRSPYIRIAYSHASDDAMAEALRRLGAVLRRRRAAAASGAACAAGGAHSIAAVSTAAAMLEG
eukprot:scaffold12.g7988.t1